MSVRGKTPDVAQEGDESRGCEQTDAGDRQQRDGRQLFSGRLELAKVRVIQRRAYSLRDEEYLRLKILSCMLPAI